MSPEGVCLTWETQHLLVLASLLHAVMHSGLASDAPGMASSHLKAPMI